MIKKDEERRKERSVLTDKEQNFIDHLRRKLPSGENAGRLTSQELRRRLGIPDRYVATRAFRLLAGNSQSLPAGEVFSRLFTLVASDQETKLRFIFDLHDADGDGGISRLEMKRMFDASLRQNDILLSPKEKLALVAAVFRRSAGEGERAPRKIDFSRFRRLLRAHVPVQASMLESLTDWFGGGEEKARPPKRRLTAIVLFLFTTIPAVTYRYLLILGYIALNTWLAWLAVKRYASAGANVDIQIARGAGAILNLNAALILVPMMRSFLGWLRKLPLSRLLPLDQHIEVHKLFGTVLLVVGLVHTGAHLLNYLTLARPVSLSLFHTLAGVTGVIVLAILLAMWGFAQNPIRRRGGFELFFFSHALYVIWIAAMLFHAPEFWKWTLLPLAAYFVEWVFQRLRKQHLSLVTRAQVLPGEVTEIHLQRPAGFVFQPGDYIYLRIPSVSRFEWHPFTLSSPPEELKELTVHVRSLGNWTRAVKHLFEQTPKSSHVPVGISGPYGTPSARIFKAKHAVLVAAGIGVTPFASIMGSLLHRNLAGESSKLEKVHFYWLNRGQKSFDWFGELLSQIEKKAKKGFFDLNIYMTNGDLNASTGLARIGMEALRKESKKDLLTGLASQTHFGRPDWDKVFSELSKKRGLGSVSVFYCGPAALATAVRSAALHYGFSFRKENF